MAPKVSDPSRAVAPRYYSAPYPEWCPFTPAPFQNAGVEFHLSRRRCLIGDPPGLGKTAQALLYNNSIQAKRTLIVCPASLRLNWVREIEMWSLRDGHLAYPVLKAKDGISERHSFIVISYNLLTNPHLRDAILDLRWDHLVLDEAHALKDVKGNQRSRAVWEIEQVVDRITCLSGTPIPNQPIEIYNLARMLRWSSIDRMSVNAFREHYYAEGGGMVRGPVMVDRDSEGNTVEPYFVSKLHWSNEVRNQPRNMDELQRRLRSSIMIRREKETVLEQLPPKRWHVMPVEPNTAIRKVLRSAQWSEVERFHEIHGFDAAIPVDGAISSMMRELGEAKAPAVAEYIEEMLAEGIDKIVVGAWHRRPGEDSGVGKEKLGVLPYLRKRLAKYNPVYVDGTTSPRNRQNAVDTFQDDPNCRLIIGQIMALGEGFTLTAAADVVFAEFFWVPGRNEQFLDRCHRIGQTRSVTGHLPVVSGTLDEKVASTIAFKDSNIYQALDAED